MTRIALKLLVVTGMIGGLCVAASGGLNAGVGDLTAAPTVSAQPSVVAKHADDNIVLDLTDWQETRITKGKPSNTVPTPTK